jgi:hypothetical protein
MSINALELFAQRTSKRLEELGWWDDLINIATRNYESARDRTTSWYKEYPPTDGEVAERLATVDKLKTKALGYEVTDQNGYYTVSIHNPTNKQHVVSFYYQYWSGCCALAYISGLNMPAILIDDAKFFKKCFIPFFESYAQTIGVPRIYCAVSDREREWQYRVLRRLGFKDNRFMRFVSWKTNHCIHTLYYDHDLYRHESSTERWIEQYGIEDVKGKRSIKDRVFRIAYSMPKNVKKVMGNVYRSL